MADFGLLRTFFRELLPGPLQTRRTPPSAALDAKVIQRALQQGGSANGRFASGYAYHTAHMALTIYGANNCIDLGGAPGCQLLPLAKLLPETSFVGVDRSKLLLGDGERQTTEMDLSNVTWIEDDIRYLESFDDNSVDAVISTMTLHDLPEIDDVHECLASVARVLRPSGAIYIEDYGRLKSPKSIAYFNAVNERILGDAFAKLNACSLSAAFTLPELEQAFTRFLPQAQIYSTYLIPFLNVAKTPDRDVPDELLNAIREIREHLPGEKRADLDDLRKFFRLGGWRGDPFE